MKVLWLHYYKQWIIVGGSKPATNLTVKYYGVSGSSLQLLTARPIQFSGYLISWKFYHVPDSMSCDSYAAIWREETNSNNTIQYRLVNQSETLLTPGSQSGVYNTLIQDRVVRVKQGDFVSIHVDRGPRTDCKNRVSFRNNVGEDPMATVYHFISHPVPPVLPTDGSEVMSSAKRGVAIQAYVEGKSIVEFRIP